MPELRVSIAQHYHERTKYAPQTLATKTPQWDWQRQPEPFKEYKIGTPFDLRPYLNEPRVSGSVDAETSWWQRLSRLLFCTYGLTGVVSSAGNSFYLRAAPSAGGLYPAEVYLVSHGTRYLPPGLYHYQPQTHSLLYFWDSDVWQKLQSACFWHPVLDHTELALVTTAIFHRSAWRYQDRAYRRIFLDTGHLLGNLELASALNDYRPHLIGGFADPAVNQLLYLDEAQEGGTTVVALADLLDIKQNLPLGATALPSSTQTEYPNIPDGELLHYFHQATQLQPNANFKNLHRRPEFRNSHPDQYNFPFGSKVSTVSPPISWGDNGAALEQTIVQRRSTRAYTGEMITLAELKALLDFTYQPQHYLEQELDTNPDYFLLDAIQTFVAVSGVRGLEEGCYYYAPQAQELRQIRFKNFRRELHYLGLGQDLARDAAAVVFHTADLETAVAQYGDRVYRYLHMDAGHLGQRLNLAAIHLGLGASGIGGFFDDQVNEVLGIPIDEAVLYITILGRPR